MASALYNPDLFVFKLHGDIVSAESIVLTDQDYDRLILRNPHVRSFLQAIFLNYTVLFVGYGMRDPDFNLLIRELRLIFQGYTPQHFALSPNPPDFMFEHLRNVINVQLIPYASDDGHADVVRFLEQLRQLAPFEPVPTTDYVSRGQSSETAVLD